MKKVLRNKKKKKYIGEIFLWVSDNKKENFPLYKGKIISEPKDGYIKAIVYKKAEKQKHIETKEIKLKEIRIIKK